MAKNFWVQYLGLAAIFAVLFIAFQAFCSVPTTPANVLSLKLLPLWLGLFIFSGFVYIGQGLLKKEWIPVVPFNYSRQGMSIQTDEIYNIGDEVSLSLTLHKDNIEIAIPLLRANVRYKEKHHSRFNYGVEFYFVSKSEKLSLDEDLMRIEQALRHIEPPSPQKSAS